MTYKTLIVCFSCILPAQNFADASVAHAQLARDVAGPDALVGQLHYPLPDHVREGPAVHKHAPELIHPAMPCETEGREQRKIGGWMKEGGDCGGCRAQSSVRNLIRSSEKEATETDSWERLNDIMQHTRAHKTGDKSFSWSCHTHTHTIDLYL